MPQTNQKIQKWQKEIEQISDDVEDLLYSKKQAEDLEKIIRENTFVQQNIGTFWEHYKLNLTYFLISKIWHQIDENNQSLSLVNLLKDLLSNHAFITKEWWIGQSEWLSSQTFEEEFGKESLDPNIVCQDIQNLKKVTTEIEQIRHKRIAHTDKDGKLASKISHTKITEASDLIEKLVIKYLLLLTKSGRDGLTPVSDDWQVAFTKAWIRTKKDDSD